MKLREVKRLILAATIVLSPITSAQMLPPTDIFLRPMPEKYRRAFSDFLTRLAENPGFLASLGEKDVEKLVGQTKFAEIGQSDAIAFRIEGQHCVDGDCFTVLGRIRDEKFKSEVILITGSKITVGDVRINFFGKNMSPVLFYGNKNITTLFDTPEGWGVFTSTNK